MNETGQAISAFLFHPELGNEVVPGTIAVDRTGLHFTSELYREEIPASHLVAEWDEHGEKIFFQGHHPARTEHLHARSIRAGTTRDAATG